MLSRSLTSRTWTKLPDDRCRFAPIHLCISAEFPRNIKDFRPTTIRPVTESHRLVNLLTQVPKAASGRSARTADEDPVSGQLERQARQQKRVFQNWCLDHGYERAAWGQRATAEIGRLLAGFA